MSLLRINSSPSTKVLRQFGVLAAVAAGWLIWRFDRQLVLATGVAGLFLLLAAIRPGWLRPVYLGAVYATYPIGFVMSHVILAVVYFGAFSVARGVLAIVAWCSGSESRRRSGSLWVARSEQRPPESYFHQL